MNVRSIVWFCALAAVAPAQFRVPKIPKVAGGGADRGGSSGTPGSGALGGGGRVKAELDQAERALDGCDRHIKKENPDGCTTYHAKFDDSIADAQKAIQGASIGGAAEYVTRIKDLKARRDEQLKGMQAAGDKNAALNAKFTSGDAEKDKVAIEALGSFYEEFHGFNSASAPGDELLELSARWPRVKAEVQRLLETYPIVKNRGKVDASGHELVMAVRKLSGDHEQRVAEVDKGMEKMAMWLKLDLDGANERLLKGEADGLWGSGLQSENYLNNIDLRFKLYNLIGKDHPKFDPQLEPTTRAKQKELQARLDKFIDKIVAENKPPADNYNGPDAAAIREEARKAWTAHYPDIKIVKIGLNGNWFRKAGWEWDDARTTWFKKDDSKLGGFLIIDLGHPQHLYMMPLNSYMDHINGGRRETKVGMYDRKERMNPGATFLRANVK